MKISYDKWRHLISGVPMGFLLLLFSYWLIDAQAALIIAGILVIAISIGFELFSKISGLGTADTMDAIFSIIGGAIGIVLAWLFWWNVMAME